MDQFINTDSAMYMDVAMVSKYLHLAKSTIYKWVDQDYIPNRKLRKRLIFIKEEIDEWVLNNGQRIEDLPEVPNHLNKEITPLKLTHLKNNLKEQNSVLDTIQLKYRSAG